MLNYSALNHQIKEETVTTTANTSLSNPALPPHCLPHGHRLRRSRRDQHDPRHYHREFPPALWFDGKKQGYAELEHTKRCIALTTRHSHIWASRMRPVSNLKQSLARPNVFHDIRVKCDYRCATGRTETTAPLVFKASTYKQPKHSSTLTLLPTDEAHVLPPIALAAQHWRLHAPFAYAHPMSSTQWDYVSRRS